MKKPLKLDTWEKRYALELLQTGEDISMGFTVPPEEQGKTVQYSYTCHPEFIYEKVADRSNGSYKIVAYRHPRGNHDFNPWNSTPALGRCVGVIKRG